MNSHNVLYWQLIEYGYSDCEHLVIVEDYFKTVFSFHSACKLTVPMYFLFGLVLETLTHTVAQVGLNS